ncbi:MULTISPECIES: spore coat U domain-containing protein [unclassified Acinetobacter]|uniref:Csu type fimbrial protein n=1 Tax=unclassified Acinetobacter TaxID=196816 RepID=UPI002934A1D7|nr:MULTISPECIES: spore coat U domain-containing protein [unclassified Acinetobacter]WOE33224.1 spore coat U domain-containing protein [Acinetobacter sp. SAAs470]WOE36995.1 spore coat U domain-containing protein [Acinetobacter sp. SAAs474]
MNYRTLLFFSFIACYTPAYAESCWISGGNLNLGRANIQGSSIASTDISVNCNSNWNQTVSYKFCLVIDSISPEGQDPRQMINYDHYPAPLLNYQLYYDAARSNKISNSNTKSSAVCQTFKVAPNTGNPTSLIKLYGQVLANQNPAAGYYKTNSVNMKLYYAYRYGLDAPSDLEALSNEQDIATNNLVVTTNYENSCLILTASDIDFGSVERLNSNLSGMGMIQLACPAGTNLKVSLDAGNNALGSQRRMRNILGHYLKYNLYQKPNYSTIWQANTTYSVTEQRIPVYAVVPAQSIQSIGKYSDTITITLTY